MPLPRLYLFCRYLLKYLYLTHRPISNKIRRQKKDIEFLNIYLVARRGVNLVNRLRSNIVLIRPPLHPVRQHRQLILVDCKQQQKNIVLASYFNFSFFTHYFSTHGAGVLIRLTVDVSWLDFVLSFDELLPFLRNACIVRSTVVF